MSDRVTPEELRERAGRNIWNGRLEVGADLLSAADRIEALTAERDEAVALLREAEIVVWSAAEEKLAGRMVAFLARLDAEGEG